MNDDISWTAFDDTEDLSHARDWWTKNGADPDLFDSALKIVEQAKQSPVIIKERLSIKALSDEDRDAALNCDEDAEHVVLTIELTGRDGNGEPIYVNNHPPSL